MLLIIAWGSQIRGVMAKMLDRDRGVREFKLQSRYYVYFQTNIPGKGMELIYHTLPAMG